MICILDGVNTEQVIPLPYCSPLPKSMGDVCKEILTRVPHTWLLPNLFHLIWTRLRDEPMGDTSNWPEWSLKVGMSNVEQLLPDSLHLRRCRRLTWRAGRSSASSCLSRFFFSTVWPFSTAFVKLSFQQLSDLQRSAKKLYIMSSLYICIRFPICKISDLPTPLELILPSNLESMEETLNHSHIVQSRAY